MTRIEIPDEVVPLLEAKAAAEGLTLNEWLQKLATQAEHDQGEMSNSDAAASERGKRFEIPRLHLGVMGPLHRRDIYDDMDDTDGAVL